MHKIKRIHSLFLFIKDSKKTALFYKDLGFDVEESENTVRIIFGDFRIALKQEDELKNHP